MEPQKKKKHNDIMCIFYGIILRIEWHTYVLYNVINWSHFTFTILSHGITFAWCDASILRPIEWRILSINQITENMDI